MSGHSLNNSSSKPLVFTGPGNKIRDNFRALSKIVGLLGYKEDVQVQNDIVETIKLLESINILLGDRLKLSNPSAIEEMNKKIAEVEEKWGNITQSLARSVKSSNNHQPLLDKAIQEINPMIIELRTEAKKKLKKIVITTEPTPPSLAGAGIPRSKI